MDEFLQLGDVSIRVTRKDVKNVHLSVHPPKGHVTLVAPRNTRLEVARAFAITKLDWIRRQQADMQEQAREAPRRYVTRETHLLWGRRHLLVVEETHGRTGVQLDHKRIVLRVRPGSDEDKRAEIMHAWHRSLLHAAIPRLIQKWEPKLGVSVNAYYLQRMKTKWGSCNPAAGNIRLNTELVKKPRDLLEYVIVHEMAHLLEPTHNDRFVGILDLHSPGWREARADLNGLPLAAEVWRE